MAGDQQSIEMDALLAAALRGDMPAWPGGGDCALGVERILYHGIAGLIAERAGDLAGWPSELLAPARDQAIAQAMWEMRHKPMLAALLAAFAEAGITALLLKGSALAYDLYPAPAARSRGDSDLLIDPAQLDQTRGMLGRLGFERESEDLPADDLALQEVWSAPGYGGTRHHIDLHWQLLNAPALRKVMDMASCADQPLALPRLGPGAVAMSHVSTLLHTCVHRAMHITAPYFVGGATYYGGDRLIWAKDIDLLAAALSEVEWDEFADRALGQRVAVVCLNGLEAARRALGTTTPAPVLDRLGEARDEPASAYLLEAGQVRRSWADLLAIGGWKRKLAYAAARALPSPAFMRSKYPDMRDRPLAALHARRMIDLVRTRPISGHRG